LCGVNGETGAVNPIFKREFYARWRDWRSHALLFVLVLALAIAAFWVYRAVIGDSSLLTSTSTGAYNPSTGRYGAPETLATRAARVGRELFQGLTLGNVGVFFLLAPLLTATGVVRERERGLLESLQLSRMSSASQIRARATSALLFLGALQLATIPVVFVAFSFGGISLQDIARAWLLTGVTALLGVGLGIAISSGAARPSGALFGAIALIAVWTGLAWFGAAGASSPYGLFGLGWQLVPVALALFDSHPFTFTIRLLDPATIAPQTYFAGRTPVATTFWTPTQALPFAFAFWITLGMLGLWKASRDVTRAFAPAGWAGRNPYIERWKKRRETRLAMRRAKASARVEGALLADLPFDKWIHFKNPLLNREVKSRFRLRRGSAFIWLARFVIFAAGVSAWVFGGTVMLDPVGRSGGAMGVLIMEWLLGVVLVGTFAAAGFAREREAGTWEGVRLSLLSSGEITRTKWLSPLLAFALLSSPLWLLLFGYLPLGSWHGTPARVMFCDALVVASSLILVSAIATWVSLRARSTTSATCWTLGILLFLLAGLPILAEVFNVTDRVATAVVGVMPEGGYVGYDTCGARGEKADDAANDPSCVSLYTDETGRTLRHTPPSVAPPAVTTPPRLPAGGSPPPAASSTLNKADSTLFQEWFQAKQAAAQQIADATMLWHPVMVLDVADKTGGTNDPSPRTKHRDINTAVMFCLAHATFCALCAALLLALVTRQLNRQRE